MDLRIKFYRSLVTAACLSCWLLSLGCTSVPRNSLAIHDPSRWKNEIAAYTRSDATNPPPRGCIVFIGASYIRKWAPRLATDFPDMQAIDRGFGGAWLADVYYYADQIVIPYEPREVVVYAGGNDIFFGLRPEIVYGDFVALMTKLHHALPQTKLVFISLPPSPSRLADTEKFKEANDLIAEYCRHHNIGFVNTFALMLGPDGKPLSGIYSKDRLHMNDAGYDIWRDAVKPFLIPPK
jgi:lysophospholipase L1-like esterase